MNPKDQKLVWKTHGSGKPKGEKAFSAESSSHRFVVSPALTESGYQIQVYGTAYHDLQTLIPVWEGHRRDEGLARDTCQALVKQYGQRIPVIR